ncbi:AMP-dependent synthetase [Maritimibacter sp. 55A14]|uniref:AMP-binding protein n=1 Tax=Maritimibacter sp. 55A14 TaxID=2174844 RepID=UPI000D61F13C|nr:AMP-binding protein [Maritimibacter sp. 55A14]PWE34131.1 AMP-dependent synthetase [Maritimibacter sp. 55A14]
MRKAFRWPVLKRFNIADVCCEEWARFCPEKVAIVQIGAGGARREITYGALSEASNRLANVLRDGGVGQGDRVAVYLAQSAEVLIAHMAAYKLGAIVLPLFTLFGAEALEYRLADSGAAAVVSDRANLPKLAGLRDRLPDLRLVLSVDGPAEGALDWQGAQAEASPDFTPVETMAEDPAVLIYTSGTTGPPKGALHAHRFLIGHLPSMECHHEGFPQPGDKGWTPADWAWIGGLMDMAIPCLYYGVPLVAHRMAKFDPAAAWALIAHEGIRNLFLPPTALKLMRGAEVPAGVDIRTIGSGGESLGAEILAWGREMLGVGINEIYGQTECNLVLASCHGTMEVRPGSMGKAVPGHEVAVIDADGREMPPGEIGEIAVRRPDPVMFLGYWKQPEKTAGKFTGDWMRTGDLGRRDAEGYFTFVARDDDVITSAGYRIGPTEIETCLAGHPDVVMAAAVGVPDPERTEVVKAYVVLREGAARDGLEAELIARVRARVSPHVAPRSIEAIDEMPMTATGKIMRRALRDRG